MNAKYDDIINMKHHRSLKHPHMPTGDRAAQFAPFSPLAGHKNAINETARITDASVKLTQNSIDEINSKISYIKICGLDCKVAVTYFVRDKNKKGGAYIIVEDVIKKVDEYKKIIVMDNDLVIDMNSIVDINAKIFDDIYINQFEEEEN